MCDFRTHPLTHDVLGVRTHKSNWIRHSSYTKCRRCNCTWPRWWIYEYRLMFVGMALAFWLWGNRKEQIEKLQPRLVIVAHAVVLGMAEGAPGWKKHTLWSREIRCILQWCWRIWANTCCMERKLHSWELTYPLQKVTFESMIFLSPRSATLVPWRVTLYIPIRQPNDPIIIDPNFPGKLQYFKRPVAMGKCWFQTPFQALARQTPAHWHAFWTQGMPRFLIQKGAVDRGKVIRRWWFRNPVNSTRWGNGSLSHYLQGFIHPNGGWPWDFWTINSMIKFDMLQMLKKQHYTERWWNIEISRQENI